MMVPIPDGEVLYRKTQAQKILFVMYIDNDDDASRSVHLYVCVQFIQQSNGGSGQLACNEELVASRYNA